MTHHFVQPDFYSWIILTTSSIRDSNSFLDILPSPFASSYLKTSFISSYVGCSTWKESVSFLRSIPNSWCSMNPDLSVSNSLKASFIAFLAVCYIVDSDISQINKYKVIILHIKINLSCLSFLLNINSQTRISHFSFMNYFLFCSFF